MFRPNCPVLFSVLLVVATPLLAEDKDKPAPAKPGADKKEAIPAELQELFKRLDELGRSKVADAKYVELRLGTKRTLFGGGEDRQWSETGWLISEDKESISLLRDDLLPWKYLKGKTTKLPSNWNPSEALFQSVKDADFEKLCKELSTPEKEPEGDKDLARVRRSLRGPGPSYRLLVAHAAWKRGRSDRCLSILALEPAYKEDFGKYKASVLEDLAWLHFLRGVNLLMFADRAEVLPHLRLVSEIALNSKHAADAKDLVAHLERLVAKKKEPEKAIDVSKLSDEERAELYIRQLVDLRCYQMSQPGDILIYGAFLDGFPTASLRNLGMRAVPALIKALEDDTPTRTIYHWRDFAHSRMVWRVSDFAWHLLRDITKRDFGYRRIVGFTFGSMKADEKRETINEIKKWYAANKDATPDQRMLAMFSSEVPEDWLTAGKYFLKTKDKRAVEPLLKKIKEADRFTKGDLCELVAQFGDPAARKVIKDVLDSAEEHADRLSAAIALWGLGDDAGVPVVIKYVQDKEQRYGSWDTPVWFLMKTKKKEAIDALKSVVTGTDTKRAGGVVSRMADALSGDLSEKRHEPAGCVEIVPVFVAAMDKADYTGGTINDIKVRTKDVAAKAFVLLRDGTNDPFPGRFAEVDPKVFNELEPDEGKRDAQIEELKKWYEKNKDKLAWDSKKNRLTVKK